MKTELIRIGNSRGVRIPKTLIEQCGLGEKVDLRVENQRLIISPERQPREDWNEVFRAAAPVANDELLLEGIPSNRFDEKEWQW